MTDDLALEHQVCFALYAASRVTQGAYRTVLTDLGLTYPQWLVLLALWEEDGQTVTALGDRLLLDSGTLSPLLRRMADRGLVTRERTTTDGRQVVVTLTADGRALRGRADDVRRCLADAVPLTADDLATLRDLAHRLVAGTRHQGEPR